MLAWGKKSRTCIYEKMPFFLLDTIYSKMCVEQAIGKVSDIKKAPWQKNFLVFQRFLAVVYSVAFAV
jgi:hypothetical protein